jgi:hypothetical protein
MSVIRTIQYAVAIVLAGMTLLAAPCRAQAPYGAVAVGTNGCNGRMCPYFCTGSSTNFLTQAVADQKAVEGCAGAQRGCADCQVKVRFQGRHACMYRTTGDNGTNLGCVGVGPTPADALRRCQRSGCRCAPPMAACNR